MSVPQNQKELKFVLPFDRIGDSIFGLFTENPNIISGYVLTDKTEMKIEDCYFDTKSLVLEKQDISCRLRKINSQEYLFTIKRKVTLPSGENYYTKIDRELDEQEYTSLVQEKQLPESDFVKLNCAFEPIKMILKLKNKRLKFTIQAENGSIGTINLDKVEYYHPETNQAIGKGYEIELKSIDGSSPELNTIADFLQTAFNLIPIKASKVGRCRKIIQDHIFGAVKKKVILDMDPGVDDALAILLALNSEELDVKAITIVGGNVDATNCAQNAAAILTYLKKMGKTNLPPIYRGESLKKGTKDASDVHGKDGLGNIRLEENEFIDPDEIDQEFTKDEKAVQAMQRIIKENPDEVTIIATGPLTNIAKLIEEDEDTARKIKEIIAMGGVFFHAGNRTRAAEFNIHADPEAAQTVVEFCRQPKVIERGRWEETVPLTFVPLDVTHQVRLRRKTLKEMLNKKQGKKKIIEFVQQFTKVYMDFYNQNEGLDGCYLHDPLAVGFAINPAFCEVEQYHIDVETKGEIARGASLADYRPTRIFKERLKEVTYVCYKVDSEAFEDFFLKRVFAI